MPSLNNIHFPTQQNSLYRLLDISKHAMASENAQFPAGYYKECSVVDAFWKFKRHYRTRENIPFILKILNNN